jgi:hypothetical protein
MLESQWGVTPFLGSVCRCGEGLTVRRDTLGMQPGSSEELSSLRGVASRFSMSVLDQADNPRRLVSHDDDSDVSSCAYPLRNCARRDSLVGSA